MGEIGRKLEQREGSSVFLGEQQGEQWRVCRSGRPRKEMTNCVNEENMEREDR